MKHKQDIDSGNETILLVDDEEMVVEVGRRLLEKLGYKVLTASTGNDAVEIYRNKRSKIELVIMDMIMPEMGGSQLYDQLKAINPSVRALLSSGYTIDGQAKDILDRGCSGFIQKPFTLHQLSCKIREILEPQTGACHSGGCEMNCCN